MRSIFTLSLLLCMLQNFVDDTKATIRLSRVKIEPKDPIFPSWLEEIVKKSGKRTRKEVLDFMQNLGIKFVKAEAKNASTNRVQSTIEGGGVRKIEIVIGKPDPELKSISDVNGSETEKISADIRSEKGPSIKQVQNIINKTEDGDNQFMHTSEDSVLTLRNITEATMQTKASESVSSITIDSDGMKQAENKTMFTTDAKFINTSDDNVRTLTGITQTTMQTNESDSVSSVTVDIDGMKQAENNTLFTEDAGRKKSESNKRTVNVEEGTSRVSKKRIDIGRKIKSIFT